MENLQKSTVIYPPPDELLYGGDKVVLTANLDAIAREMATARPLTEARNFTENRLEVVGVYKRGYSSRCDDVVIVRSEGDIVMRPENIHKTPIKLARRAAEKEQRMTPSTGFHIIDHDWLVQAYMRSLHDHRFGELRCYVIGGRVTRIVQTSPWKDGTWTEKLSRGCLTRQKALYGISLYSVRLQRIDLILQRSFQQGRCACCRGVDQIHVRILDPR